MTAWLWCGNHDLLFDHLADLNLDFFFHTDWNTDSVVFGLFFVHRITDGDCVRFLSCLLNTDSVVDHTSLLFWNLLADRHLANTWLSLAELNLVFVFLL